MTEQTTSISIEYKENCDYNGSIANKDITVPLQETEGSVYFTNHTKPRTERINDEDVSYYYYTDVLEIHTHFTIKDTNTFVQYGEVNFYYINNNDIQKIKQLINPSPIELDKTSSAKVLFMPPESGKIEVEYITNDYFNTSTCFNTFELRPMPTTIQFEEEPPYLKSYEDTVDLSVMVKDIDGNPVDYGVVTFLNYSKHDINDADDAHEKVIDNPAYVENGVAKIKYSPIQYVSDNDLYGTLELIKAVYNYDNKIYGVNWKYYGMSEDYTSVGIYQTNQINLFQPLKSNTTLDKNLGGMFTIEQGETLQLRCSVLYNNEVLSDGKIIFYLASIDKDTPPIAKYGEDVIYSSQGQFYETTFNGLPAGLYNAYAYVETFEEDTSVEIAGTIPTSHVTGEPIVDEKYVTGAYSNTYCIEVTKKQTTYTVTLNHNQDIISPNETYNPWCEIITDTPNLFIGEECYFYVTKTQQRIKGVIKQNNNKLIASANITFSDVGDYSLYAYVPPVTNKYEGAYSEQYLNVKVRNQIVTELTFAKDTVTYPNQTLCIVNVSNIFDESLQVTLEAFKNNENCHTYVFDNNFTQNNHRKEYKLPLLDAGTYIIKASVKNNTTVVSTDSKTITIEKGTLLMSINGTSKKVNTGIQTDIIMGIEEIDGKDIITPAKRTEENLLNNIEAYLTATLQHNDKNDIQISNLEIDNIIDNYYIVQITGTIYDKGSWGVKLNYNNPNGNYNVTNNDFLEFQAYNQNAYVQISGDTTTTKYGRITYDPNIDENNIITTDQNYTYTLPQYILIITIFKNENDEYVNFMHITNQQGQFTITKPNNIESNIAWSKYNIVEYIIDPKLTINDISIINTIKTTNYNDFITLFEDYNIQFDETQYNNLKQQSSDFYYTNLFLGYDEENGETEIAYLR